MLCCYLFPYLFLWIFVLKNIHIYFYWDFSGVYPGSWLRFTLGFSVASFLKYFFRAFFLPEQYNDLKGHFWEKHGNSQLPNTITVFCMCDWFCTFARAVLFNTWNSHTVNTAFPLSFLNLQNKYFPLFSLCFWPSFLSQLTFRWVYISCLTLCAPAECLVSHGDRSYTFPRLLIRQHFKASILRFFKLKCKASKSSWDEGKIHSWCLCKLWEPPFTEYFLWVRGCAGTCVSAFSPCNSPLRKYR